MRLMMLRTILSGPVPLERTRRMIALRWAGAKVSIAGPKCKTNARTMLPFWEFAFGIGTLVGYEQVGWRQRSLLRGAGV